MKSGIASVLSARSFGVRPVARLRTPFAQKFGVPRQSGLVEEAVGRVEFLPEFAREDFVRGLDAFSHVWLVTWFHRSAEWSGAATVRPPRLGGNDRVGVFASRSPNRPNPLGLSLVRLLAIETAPALALRVAGIDAVDGSPVLDVKPYLPWCEALPVARADWAGDAPCVREAGAVSIPPPIAARLVRGSGSGPEGVRTLELVRHLLRLDLQPAYQRNDTGSVAGGGRRSWGMTVAGWNIRWQASDDGRGVEVVEAEQSMTN
ncbi:MAG: tRNA (N6-threonylcarbamoyladenosine(37)-N6)-methyltransferase TrmO [Opitutaceae bacterium]|jgi:tRNA-Thr(GGU) m(6)t(6)A37 methyltransferase TsaA|nr:tRNA (N6-threonylcarbamoyladenosine(37)-N6)-methyltransferase TrmO [Opitutaceae bacterium]